MLRHWFWSFLGIISTIKVWRVCEHILFIYNPWCGSGFRLSPILYSYMQALYFIFHCYCLVDWTGIELIKNYTRSSLLQLLLSFLLILVLLLLIIIINNNNYYSHQSSWGCTFLEHPLGGVNVLLFGFSCCLSTCTLHNIIFCLLIHILWIILVFWI